MKALVYDNYGGAERLRIAERPVPDVGPREVRVRVAAASLNPIDWKLRSGEFRLMQRGGWPRIPGADLAGTVAAVGREVRDLAVGQRVFGLADPLLAGGSLAEFCALARARVVKLPDGVSFEDGAATPLAALTALQGLTRQGGLARGGRGLILGASGGVGTFAVQIAKRIGAHVTATTSARHVDLVRTLGADVVIDYAQTPAEDIAGPFDVIFDVAGVSSFGRMREQLAASGTYVSTLPGPDTIAVGVLTLLAAKRARVVVMQADPDDLSRLARWLAEGALTPVIGHRFPLDQGAEAYRLSESGRATGKIVVTLG